MNCRPNRLECGSCGERVVNYEDVRINLQSHAVERKRTTELLFVPGFSSESLQSSRGPHFRQSCRLIVGGTFPGYRFTQPVERRTVFRRSLIAPQGPDDQIESVCASHEFPGEIDPTGCLGLDAIPEILHTLGSLVHLTAMRRVMTSEIMDPAEAAELGCKFSKLWR